MRQKAPTWETDDATVVEAALSATFNQIVGAAVTLLVGIYVFSEIAGIMPTPDNNRLSNASATVQNTTG